MDVLEEVHGHVLLDRAGLIVLGGWQLDRGKLCLEYYLLKHLILLSVIVPAYHLLDSADSLGYILVVLLFWHHQELGNEQESAVVLKQLGIELAGVLDGVELHEVLGDFFDEYLPGFLAVDLLVI